MTASKSLSVGTVALGLHCIIADQVVHSSRLIPRGRGSESSETYMKLSIQKQLKLELAPRLLAEGDARSDLGTLGPHMGHVVGDVPPGSGLGLFGVLGIFRGCRRDTASVCRSRCPQTSAPTSLESPFPLHEPRCNAMQHGPCQYPNSAEKGCTHTTPTPLETLSQHRRGVPHYL